MKFQVLCFLILCISCSVSTKREENLTVKSSVNGVQNSCADYKNWEERDFEWNWNPYENLKEAYRVKKIGNVFHLYLKVALRSLYPNSKGVYEYRSLEKNVQKKWQKCFSEVNEKTRYDGQKILFYLMEYEKSKEMPIAVLGDKASELGDNEQFWLLDASCAEILTYSFKLMGLRSEKKSEEFICRPLSLVNSPMNDMEEALYGLKREGYDYIVSRCECDREQNSHCDEILSSGYQAWGKDGSKSCPKGSYFINEYWLKKDLWLWGQKNQKKIEKYYKRSFSDFNKKLLCEAYSAVSSSFSHCETLGKQNFLYPSQFRSLLYPRCEKRNFLYEKCSLNSHRKKHCLNEGLCKKGNWLK